MPINSIQFRAGIGLFYNALVGIYFYNAPSHSFFEKLVQDSMKGEFRKYCPSPSHLLSFSIVTIMFPFIVLLTMTFFKSFNIVKIFRLSYIYVYACTHFIKNLVWKLAYHKKSFFKFALQYNFFLQSLLVAPYIRLALIMSGDIESNPGPETCDKNISVCHWNLNGIAANNFIKISLLEAYNTMHNFDIICISETFLDSSYPIDDQRLSLEGYTMIRSDHPSNTKRGGVCLYYKEHIPFIRRDDITSLDECIVGEVKVKRSKCFVTCLYRSPNQTADETDAFLSGIDQTWSSIAMESPTCSLVLGDMNAKCTNWWATGINNPCGLELFTISSLLGYSQLVNEPTNFEPNKLPSCIDLIFISKPNLVVESGVHPSLISTCHHQITFAKVSFKVILPSPYEREIWHYKRAQIPLIQRSIESFDWNSSFKNLSVNEQVELFNETLLNIYRNFIPHEKIKCNSRDPPWMNKEIKNALRHKNRLYKRFISGGRQEDETNFREASKFISNLIEDTKSSYFTGLGEKLNDPLIGPKTYWSILKRLMNKVKIPTIPPLLVNGTFVTNFAEKAGIFNAFFANQCNILENNSIIPELNYKTNMRISNIVLTSADLSKIIKEMNPNKAHGHDNISIKMIQLSGNSIIYPLKLIFETAIRSNQFPDSWKMGVIIPVHKKENKNLIKNYRPISLLPIFGKIFEKIIYNNLFRYFEDNKFLSDKQSGFRAGDSCVSQLLAITNEIYKSFDCNPALETRGVFLDISKAFDKVWHEGLLYKLKSYGVDGCLYSILDNYLQNRKQKVVLSGQSSSWLNVNAGVPQGSVLGPLLFLIYINDLPENLVTTTRLFADDTSIFSTVYDVTRSSESLNRDLSTIKDWAFQWKMSFNPDPSKQASEVVFSRKRSPTDHPILVFNESTVVKTPIQKHLGLFLDNKLTFDHHINEKITKATKGISLIKRLHRYLPRKSLLCIYKSYVRPHLDYADVIYDQPHNDFFCRKIESVQYNAALAITGAIKGSSRERLYQELGLESLSDRRWYHRQIYFFKIISGISPNYLHAMLPMKQFSRNQERGNLFRNFRTNTEYYKNSFFPYCVDEWNKLGPCLKNVQSIKQFKTSLLDFIRPKASPVYGIQDPIGLKLLTRLRLKFSHLREHKFRHNFLDTLNPLCSCGYEIESTSHYLLRCSIYTSSRRTLLESVSTVIGPTTDISENKLVNILLFGDQHYRLEQNSFILKNTIKFLKVSERFDIPLF